MTGNGATAHAATYQTSRAGALRLLYFAYGSNMNPQQIKTRCLGAEVLAVARLVDHRLAFFGSSTVWDGALETVVPAPGRDVWGVLYALSPLDADSLDAWQDARFDGTGAYFHFPVVVVDVLGQCHEALLYKKDLLGRPQKPSREYLEHIARGAETRGLPPEYIDNLRGLAAQKASYPVPIPQRWDGDVPRGTTCGDCGSLPDAD